MTEEAPGNSRWWFSRRESAASVRLRLKATPGQIMTSALGWGHYFVGRPGLDPADGSDLWFMAHPKEEPLNHSLVTVRHRARRARVTRDHRIKSPLQMQRSQRFSAPP